jgi:hypothetical protein
MEQVPTHDTRYDIQGEISMQPSIELKELMLRTYAAMSNSV